MRHEVRVATADCPVLLGQFAKVLLGDEQGAPALSLPVPELCRRLEVPSGPAGRGRASQVAGGLAH